MIKLKSFTFRRIGPEETAEKKPNKFFEYLRPENIEPGLFLNIVTFVLYAIGIIFIIVTGVLTTNTSTKSHEYGSDTFRSSLSFNLIISLVIFCDVLTEFLFQHEVQELIRPYCLLLITFPNILMYFEIIPILIVPLVQYFQYIALFELISFHVQSLSTMQVCKLSVQNILKISGLTFICYLIAFFYNLSQLNVIGKDESSKLALHVLFTIGLFVLHYQVYQQTYQLIKETLSMIFWSKTKISYFHQTRKRVFLSYLGLQFSSIIVLLLYTIFSFSNNQLVPQQENDHNENVIFFTHEIYYSTILEWYFSGLLIALFLLYTTNIRNKMFLSTKELSNNKMLTRSISHEIRTPLNTAFMALELLQDSMKYPNFNETEIDRLKNWLETVDNVREACDIALGILNQLLTFDKLQSGMLQLERRLIPILSVIDMNTKLFRMQAIQSGINFSVDMSNEEKEFFNDISLFIDEHKLNQVIRNLLSNAMKFTPKSGSVKVKITLDMKPTPTHFGMSVRGPALMSLSNSGKSTSPLINSDGAGDSESCCERMKDSLSSCFSRNGNNNSQTQGPPHVEGSRVVGTLKISIVDSGPGIDPEDQKKLFREYVQISPGELQKGQGSGLGLSISKSIVTLHGGNIGVFSAGKNCGSTFFVELPAYRKKIISNNLLLNGEFSVPPLISRSASIGEFFSKSMKYVVPSANNTNNHHSTANNTNGFGLGLLQRLNIVTSGAPKTTAIPSPQISPIPNKTEGKTFLDRAFSQDYEHNSSKDTAADYYDPHRLTITNPNAGLRDSIMTTITASNINISTSFTSDNGYSHRDSSHITPMHQKNPNSPNRIAKISPIRIGSHRLSKQLLVLIVDDSAANRKMLARLLTRDGHAIIEADDGIAAVEIVRESIAGFTTRTTEREGTSKKRISFHAGDNNNNNNSNSPSQSPPRLLNPSILNSDHSLDTHQTSQTNSRTNLINNVHVEEGIIVTPSRMKPIVEERPKADRNSMKAKTDSTYENNSSETAPLAPSNSSDGPLGGLVMHSSYDDNDINHYHRKEDHTQSMSSHNLANSSSGDDDHKLFPADHGHLPVVQQQQQQHEEEMNTPVPRQYTSNTQPPKIIPFPSQSNRFSNAPKKIDLILMDNFMKEMDGPQAAKIIRNLGYEGPILGVTGLIDDDCDDFITSGVDLILRKPINMSSIWNALKSLKYV